MDEPDPRTARAAAFHAAAADLTWEQVAAPLAAYLADPRPAADRAERRELPDRNAE